MSNYPCSSYNIQLFDRKLVLCKEINIGIWYNWINWTATWTNATSNLILLKWFSKNDLDGNANPCNSVHWRAFSVIGCPKMIICIEHASTCISAHMHGALWNAVINVRCTEILLHLWGTRIYFSLWEKYSSYKSEYRFRDLIIYDLDMTVVRAELFLLRSTDIIAFSSSNIFVLSSTNKYTAFLSLSPM